MKRGIVLLALAVAASAAAPAQARMSYTALFGSDFMPSDLGGIGGLSVQHAADPAGALFERMFRDFSAAPERMPRAKPRNDIDATLEAMEQSRMGFGDVQEPRSTRRLRKARPRS